MSILSLEICYEKKNINVVYKELVIASVVSYQPIGSLVNIVK